MGFLITVLFVFCSYISLPDTFPFLAQFRPIQILAVAAILFTIITFFSSQNSFWAPQVAMVLGFAALLIISQPLHGWLGGGIEALTLFLPATVIYFLVAMNTHTVTKFKVLAFVLIVISAYFGYKGYMAMTYGQEEAIYTVRQRVDLPNGEFGYQLRARGVGFLGDPNDLAQNHVVSLALLGLFWKKKQFFRNAVVVLLPGALLLYVLYLTGSRGGLVGVFILFAFMLQNRLGPVAGPAFSAGIMALLTFLFGFGGGRAIGISSSGSSGRLDTWSEQIPLIVNNPIFGVGWNGVRSYTKHTSHNSYLLCAVELGLPTYFLWMALIVSTIIYLNHVMKETKKMKGREDITQVASCVRLALFTFLATSWFLSRTYVVSTYVLLGLGMAVYYMALHQNVLRIPKPERGWVKPALLGMVFTLGSIYIQVRIRWMS